MRLRSSHLIAVAGAVGLGAWLISGQIGADRSPPEATTAAVETEAPLFSVRVRELVAEPITREVVVNGKTAPARSVTIRAETNGRVVAVGPDEGVKVVVDTLLVRLDPRERRAMVEEAMAMLRMREIEHGAAESLGEKGFQAETKVAEAEANLEAAQAALARSRIELGHTEIVAPFDGVLEHRAVEIGDFVDVGDSVATVIEQDPYLIVGEVAERDIGRLAVGMPGRARLVDGRVVEGRLRFVGSRADPATRSFTVELEVANPAGRFAAGVSAELTIGFGRTLAHRVPSSLLALSDDGVLGVKAVDADDVVRFHPAEVVRADAEGLWLAGLPEHIRLITVGQGYVRAGDTVRAVPEAVSNDDPSGPLLAEKPA